ncbi:MAG: DUF2284 domain-containing protein [Candidatus Caldatribacteriaceae bacterium]
MFEELLKEVLVGKVETHRLVNPQEVVTAEWVRWKCQYGCDGYGRSLTCPLYAPSPEITRETLDSYHREILIWKKRNLKICVSFAARWIELSFWLDTIYYSPQVWSTS